MGDIIPGRQAARHAGDAETIRIGVLWVSACGPLMIAQEKGYFAKEGLTAELMYSPRRSSCRKG